MLALARQAARNIGERMLDKATVNDRTLLEYFVHERQRAHGPIVRDQRARDDHQHGRPPRVVGRADHPRLWQLAKRRSRRTTLGYENWKSTLRRLRHAARRCVQGNELVGALLRFSQGHRSSVDSPTHLRPSDRTTLGWWSLRESELGIAQLVAKAPDQPRSSPVVRVRSHGGLGLHQMFPQARHLITCRACGSASSTASTGSSGPDQLAPVIELGVQTDRSSTYR